MIVLPRYYRFTVLNNCGQTISTGNVKVYGRRFKFDSSGALSYESTEATIWTSGGTVANAAYLSSSFEDNNTNKWIGGAFAFEVTAPASANGNVILFFERSTDGTTRVDTNGAGDVVAVLNFTTSGIKYKTFSL
jgi:hypothetical protein